MLSFPIIISLTLGICQNQIYASEITFESPYSRLHLMFGRNNILDREHYFLRDLKCFTLI